MKKIAAICLLGLIVITSAWVVEPVKKQDGMSLEVFMKRVSRNDKIVFVYFNADWCVPCIKLKPGMEEMEKEVDAYCEVMKMDVDDNPAIATHFEINTLPMFMIFKNGKCVWKNIGSLTKAQLKAKIDANK